MTVERNFSQGQGALKKDRRLNSVYDSFPTIQTMVDVAVASNTSVAAAVTLASGVVTTISGGTVTDPAEYRAIRIKGNQAGVTGTVVVTGYDRGGRLVTDRIAASGASAIDGVVPMNGIAFITMPARFATGDTISVGVSEKLGLYRPIATTADVVLMERKATAATEFTTESTTGTVNAAYGTVVPSGGIVADDSFKLSFLTKLF